ncbi:MAG: signal peptide peptidase SppA [Armatimonadota bacterium]
MEDETPSQVPDSPRSGGSAVPPGTPSEPEPEAPRVSAPPLIPEAPRWPQPTGAAAPTPVPPQPPPPPWGVAYGPTAQPPPTSEAAPPPSAPRRKTSRGWLIAIAAICAILLIGAVVIVIAVVGAAGDGGGFGVGEQIALIRVEGLISGSSGGSIFGIQRGTERILEHLKRAGKDRSVRAVVIRINSPGGSAAASQELHDAILDLRKDSGKVVVVSMSDVAASGGYYAAVAADKIIANPATMTGSIGAAWESWEIAELMEKYGVGANAITSGKYKDTGSMFRKMRADERELVQDMVDDVYDQFLEAVYEGRRDHLTPDQIRSLTNGAKARAADLTIDDFRSIADGRVFTGRQAKEKGLVDALGGLDEAVEIAKKEAGIEGRVHLKEYGRRTPLEEILGGPYSSTSRDDLLRELMLSRELGPVARILRAPSMYTH